LLLERSGTGECQIQNPARIILRISDVLGVAVEALPA
jgi:hypothetical protein